MIDQKGCRFLPHAVALHKDQKLVFKSSDPVGHNIRYTGFTRRLASTRCSPPTARRPVKFTAAEKNPVELVCDIHPWMTGYFMVFDHPFFAVTKPDGSFEIKGVPAGTQKPDRPAGEEGLRHARGHARAWRSRSSRAR